MTKKERLAEYNQSNILAAAQRLFDEKGVALTTVDDIAREAECSKSTLYVYFGGKEEIYAHIILKSMHILRDLVRSAIMQGGGPLACYGALCRAIVEFHDRSPLYFESVIGKISVREEDMETNPVLREIYYVGEEINAELVLLIEEAQRQGSFRTDMRPIAVVFVLWAGFYGLLTMAEHKEAYLLSVWGLTREDYLRMGFQMLLRAIVREGVA